MSRQVLKYLPKVLQDVREYKAILSTAAQPEYDELWAERKNLENDLFLTSLTPNGIGRWANILQLIFPPNSGIDDQRFAIQARLNEKVPYSIRALKKMLNTLIGEDGYTISFEPETYILTVIVALAHKPAFSTIEALIERVVPLNMVINLPAMYNSHNDLGKFTHAQLAAWTHDALRKEAI